MLEPAFGVPARRPTVSVTARLAAVLEAAVDAPARPVGAAVPYPADCGVYPLIILNPPGRGRPSPAVPDAAAYGVYPLIILIVYVIVTGGILCSDESEVYLLLTQLSAHAQNPPF